MSIVFDEVIADVSSPVTTATEDSGSQHEPAQTQQVKREVLQSIERNRHRELRLKAD